MVRVKRKFTLIICGLIITAFLFFYLILNFKIPNYEKVHQLSYFENRLEHLEKQIDKIKVQKSNQDEQNYVQIEQQPHQQQIQEPNLGKNDLIRDQIIKADNSKNDDSMKCNFNMDLIPKSDLNLQMLELYKNEIKFDNVNGGYWTQGWRVEYDPKEWNHHHKLKVFVVPHSHNDPGWINTFEEYYERSTKSIFANMLRHLDEHENFKFIWAEIVYFSKWYDHLSSQESKNKVKKLIKRKQLEFVTGGWVMPDEANSHYYNILYSLTEGQTWLKTTFNVTPVSSWSIDPFGHSPTLAYILKESGFENLLIQRTHYEVKKRLAKEKQLEFRWRQIWDNSGSTELFTHMMPFYSYDIPHTCGPDPKICCQFDFKRLAGYGLTCPWRIPPQPITDENVARKADLIVDQWRKKSVLYNTRSVLIPLGDDFRYTQSTEWEAQRSNFEKLFDYINNEPSLHVEAKFATLQEYFDSVRKEKDVSNFPSLSGDFFTYADREDHYWSGYFTSRPYHKRMDRILMNYVRAAEMLHSWEEWDVESGFDLMLQKARRALSIFQHHDGVTGTAKDYVMKDYNKMMVEGIKDCKFVMQQSVYRLLTKPTIYQPDFKFQYFSIDDSRSAGNDESRPTIIIGDGVPYKYVVLHNSLPYQRNELVEFHVASPFVSVTDSDGITVQSQVTPIWTWHTSSPYNSIQPQASTTKFRLMFKADVPPLGLSVYNIQSKNSAQESLGTTYAKVEIFTLNPFTITLDQYPHKVYFADPKDVSLRIDENGPGASFNKMGFLKSISIDSNSGAVPVHLEFLKYGVRKTPGQKSGAYIFLPDGVASTMRIGSPTVLVTRGELESSVATGLPFGLHESILRSGESLEIRNVIDITGFDNSEIVMRLSTNIESGSTFFTDLNGLQIIKRERLSKIPLQANYYPIPGAIFVQDDNLRLTLLSAQPLGGSSLKQGEIEIMQERKLNQDDDRGLGQGVLDNRPVMNIFRVALESRESCRKVDDRYPGAFLTARSYYEQKKVLHPLDKFIFNENEWTGLVNKFGEQHEPAEMGIEVVALKELPHVKINKKSSRGIVIHRTNFEECTDSSHDGTLYIKRLLGVPDDSAEVFSSHLTLLKKQEQIESDEVVLCPMDIKGFIVKR